MDRFYYSEDGVQIDLSQWLQKIASTGALVGFDTVSIVVKDYTPGAIPTTYASPLWSGAELAATVCTRYVGYDLAFGLRPTPLIYETRVGATLPDTNHHIEIYKCPQENLWDAKANHDRVVEVLSEKDFQYLYTDFDHPYLNLPDNPPEDLFQIHSEGLDNSPEVGVPPIGPPEQRKSGRALLF